MGWNKIFIMSNTGATGGTELLHQLGYKLNQLGIDTYMVYSKPVQGSTVEKAFFKKYDVKIADKVEESPDNLLIMPENIIKYLPLYKNIQKAAWWLSVDNFSGARKGKSTIFRYLLRLLLDKWISIYQNKWIHFTQSEYARLYLTEERHVSPGHIYSLSDYLNSAFIEKNRDISFSNRKDNILYNPKKGVEVTMTIKELIPDYNWIPIQGMTPEEICNLMRESKLYIDFGNHPGKDRMPREAAICGCCIITGKRGAAENDIDIMIPKEYKIDDKDINSISSKINYVMSNYYNIISEFEDYRNKIKNEEMVFDKEIETFFIRKK